MKYLWLQTDEMDLKIPDPTFATSFRRQLLNMWFPADCPLHHLALNYSL